MDPSILFKISSETDLQILANIYNTALKRIQVLEAFKVIPKCAVVVDEPVETLEVKV